MVLIVPITIIISALVIVIITILLGTLVICVGRVNETNKQLLIVVAGKDEKPEALRALVASAKPPQKNLPGIATEKKTKDDKTKNPDYKMTVGVFNGV